MNELFEIKRFAKYLRYELSGAVNKVGLLFLTVSLTPVLAMVLVNTFSFFFTGSAFQQSPSDILLQQFEIAIAAMTVPLVIPTKLFGKLSSVQTGTGYLLFPVSAEEKCLSMILTLTIIPLAFFGLVLGWDALLCTTFKTAYLSSTPYAEFLWKGDMLAKRILSLIDSTMLFGLGAILFKKSQTVKTILCAIALLALLSLAMSPFSDNILYGFDSEYSLIAFPLLYLIIGAGIYFRIKTLKL